MLKQKQLVSIIMPCFNAEQHIMTTIGTVLNQTYRNYELIIVNDGSTDRSLEMITSIKDNRIKIISQDNLGVMKARNHALNVAEGAYIAFLDSDDSWDKHFLEKTVHALDSMPDVALAYCGWQNIGLIGGRGAPFIPADYENEKKIETLLEGCRWPIHAAVTKAEYIYEAGGFDERFQTSEDYLLWLKIACLNRITLVPEILAYYHFHEGQRSIKRRNAHQAIKALNHRRLLETFIRETPAVKSVLARKCIRKITHGELLKRGYKCYWDRDLESARKIFHAVMKSGYGSTKDWMYMLPSIMPMQLYMWLVSRSDQLKEREN